MHALGFIKVQVSKKSMKVAYIPKTPFGAFYYDPDSHKGVAIDMNDMSTYPVVLTMASGYDPYTHPNVHTYDVDKPVFEKLLAAATERSRAEVLSLTLQHF